MTFSSRAILSLACILGASFFSSHARQLPIYFEDNHLGSFHFFATVLDLDEPHALILIDAHSDATMIDSSDDLRRSLRRVVSPKERENRIVAWRENGLLQAYNWIEPLMPSPLAQVLWIARPTLDDSKKRQLIAEAHEHLDWRMDLGIDDREAGHLAPRFRLTDLAQWQNELPEGLPYVVSIDLDFFAGAADEIQRRQFDDLWHRLLDLPDLRAVSFALSRPWLASDDEAERLLGMAMRAALAVANGAVRFEPFPVTGPDRSELAKEHQRLGREISYFEPEKARVVLKSLWLAERGRIDVRYDSHRWEALLNETIITDGQWRLQVTGHQPSTDEVWRVTKQSDPTIELTGGAGRIRSIRWLLQEPERSVWNVLPELRAGKAFTGESSGVVRRRERLLTESLEPYLPARWWKRGVNLATGLGSMRILAEIQTEADRRLRTPVMELRVFEGQGFHAGLSEQLGLPYVFGVGLLRQGNRSGPETGIGNDCANYLVAAWRRAGVSLPWCNPAQLRDHLILVEEKASISSAIDLPPPWIEQGVAIDLGSHVAAIWKDQPPLGKLDAGDKVIHHLSGVPEILPLGQLLENRRQPQFDVRRFQAAPPHVRLVFGGDLLITEEVTGSLVADPQLAQVLKEADFAVANLEGLPSRLGQPPNKAFYFRVPGNNLEAIKQSGLDAVGLANNHTGDFGAEALTDGLSRLDAAGLPSFGAGSHLEQALQPYILELNGVRIGVLGVTCVDTNRLSAAVDRPGLACLPEHEQVLKEVMARVRPDLDCLIAFMHWGDENTGRVNVAQRRWARWLIQQGADAVIGCHSHCPQPVDTFQGRPVFYSLGNLAVHLGLDPAHPARQKPPFATASLAELRLDQNGRIVYWEQLTANPPLADSVGSPETEGVRTRPVRNDS